MLNFKKNNLHEYVKRARRSSHERLASVVASTATSRRREQYLARFRSSGVPHFIDGAPRASAIGRDLRDALADRRQRARGSRRRRRGRRRPRRPKPRSARSPRGATCRAATGANLLHRIADAIEARAEEIALLESLDTGQPIRFMSQAAKRGAENFRFFADKAPEADRGLSLPAREHVNYTLRQPLGPVAAITPWNTPFMLSTWKIAPALAAGCTVVHKPAEWSPITATLLAEIATDGGLAGRRAEHGARARRDRGQGRDGASADSRRRVRRRVGDGQRDHGAGRADAEAPALRARRQESRRRVRRRGSRARARRRRVHDLQLERRALHVVEPAARAEVDRATNSRSGSSSACASIKVGHPLDPATEVGPLIHPQHVEKVLGYFDVARGEGAAIPVGGAARGARRQLRAADGARRRAQNSHARRAGGDLRARADRDSVRRREGSARARERRALRPRRVSLDATTSAARTDSRARSRPAWSGSTPRTTAICRRRSAA